jgi:hypothetical protein
MRARARARAGVCVWQDNINISLGEIVGADVDRIYLGNVVFIGRFMQTR